MIDLTHEENAMNSAHLNQLLTDCENILTHLEDVTADLVVAIDADILAKRALRDAERLLSDAESELVTDAAMRAKVEKAGPLSHAAQSSPAYKQAVDAMLADARRGVLANHWTNAERARYAADDAQARREQIATAYSATKHAANLRAAMLNAIAE